MKLTPLDDLDAKIDIARGKAMGTEVLIGTETLAALVQVARQALIFSDLYTARVTFDEERAVKAQVDLAYSVVPFRP